MRYEEPNMRVLMLEAEDIITLSNVTGGAGDQDDQGVGNNTPAGGEW